MNLCQSIMYPDIMHSLSVYVLIVSIIRFFLHRSPGLNEPLDCVLTTWSMQIIIHAGKIWCIYTIPLYLEK